MKIIVAKHSGFCFGVKKAIEMAKSIINSDKDVYIVGEIVHNKTVINELEQLGLKSVSSINQIPDQSTIILKAHGCPPDDYQIAEHKNLKIIDATCPMVKDIHEKAQRLEAQGFQVLVFGDKDHEEVIGICGHLKNPLVVKAANEIDNYVLADKTALVCQSTQKIDEIIKVCSAAEKKVQMFIFENTLCQTTKLRQKEVKELATSADKVIVVGSKNSANTKHLFEESEKINSNTFWIETESDLNNLNLDQEDTIAIISGASTPEEIINKIATQLKEQYL